MRGNKLQNIDYLIIKRQGMKSEINHYLFNDLKTALSATFLCKQTGLSNDVISKLSKRSSFVRDMTLEKLNNFFGALPEPIFYELFEGIKHCNSRSELKEFGAKFKYNHAILLLENANKVEREKGRKSDEYDKGENN